MPAFRMAAQPRARALSSMAPTVLRAWTIITVVKFLNRWPLRNPREAANVCIAKLGSADRWEQGRRNQRCKAVSMVDGSCDDARSNLKLTVPGPEWLTVPPNPRTNPSTR